MTGYGLGKLEFEWDDAKAASNLTKHGVTFLEAATAFLDSRAQRMPDPKHSDQEERFLLLAESVGDRILVAAHTVRGLSFRIISARPAKLKERRRHDEV